MTSKSLVDEAHFRSHTRKNSENSNLEEFLVSAVSRHNLLTASSLTETVRIIKSTCSTGAI